MTAANEDSIARLVERGHHEKALGVSFAATSYHISRAHIKQLHLFRSSERTREYINRAKSALLKEEPVSKARRLLSIGEIDAALVILESNLDEFSTAHEYHLIGYTLFTKGRYAEACNYLDKAFVITPSTFNAIWMGNAYERVGRLEDALAKYLYAIEQRGEEIEYRLAGNIYFYLGRQDKALASLIKAANLGSKDEDVFEKIAIIRRRQKLEPLTKAINRLLSFFKKPKTQE